MATTVNCPKIIYYRMHATRQNPLESWGTTSTQVKAGALKSKLSMTLLTLPPPGVHPTSDRDAEKTADTISSYTLFLTFFVILMFITSVISTYLGYNPSPYCDWALAGGDKFPSPVIVVMRVYFHLLTFLTRIRS